MTAANNQGSSLGALSLLEYALGGVGSVPDGRLAIGFGKATINGVTPVTVVDPNITADSVVIWTLKTVGGTVGALPAIQTITPGTGFTVQGTASDTSVYNYIRIG